MLGGYLQSIGITALTTFSGVAHARQNLHEVSPAVVDVYQKDAVSKRGEQPYQSMRTNPVLHEWDFEVGPELVVDRGVGRKPKDLRQSSAEPLGYLLVAILLGVGIYSTYFHDPTKEEIDEILEDTKEGVRGLRGNGEWARYLRRRDEENAEKYANTLWREAQRMREKQDYEREFIALTNAALNGHEEAAATLVEIWGMFVRTESLHEHYEKYSFLRRELSTQEVRGVYDYYYFIHKNIVEWKAGRKNNVIEFKQKEEGK